MAQNNVRQVRRARDITQEELASAVGTTRQTIIGIEKGHIQRPSDELMVKIAQFFSLSVGEIFFTPLVTHMLQDNGKVDTDHAAALEPASNE